MLFIYIILTRQVEKCATNFPFITIIGMNLPKIATLVAPDPYTTQLIQIETIFRRGLPGFIISGLSSRRGREHNEKIRSAIMCSGIKWPIGHIQAHLSPADIHKSGAYLDLAIAVSIIRCIEKVNDPDSLLYNDKTLFMGELSLNGEVLPIGKAANVSLAARALGFDNLVICQADLEFVKYSDVAKIVLIKDLKDIKQPLNQLQTTIPERISFTNSSQPELPDSPAKLSRALARIITVCCAGNHSLLMIGPPGSGKSTIARLMHSMIPAAWPKQALELMNLNFQKQHPGKKLYIQRPLQSPHHSCTTRAMIGGGRPIRAGEITRAHHGILLLDELSEFKRDALQALREPMMDKCVYISRADQSQILPADFLLIATSNPCPCGFFGSDEKQCSCSCSALKHYMQLLLGPLRDRIEMEIFVGNIQTINSGQSTCEIKSRIKELAEMQYKRFEGRDFYYNADIPAELLDTYCAIKSNEARQYWNHLRDKNCYSQRAMHAIRRLARTLADLDSATEIRAIDLAEAANLRLLDNFYQDKGL